MKVLVTGAAGRLGSVAAKHLLELGYDVVGTDLWVPNRKRQTYQMESADLCDFHSCKQLVAGMEAVVHLGNIPNSARAAAHVGYTRNASCNLNVFQACHEENVPKVLFASSVQVLGFERKQMQGEFQDPAYFPVDAEAPVRPQNWYALSKEAGEKALEHYARDYGMSGVAFRFPMLILDKSEWASTPAYFNKNQERHLWRLLTMLEAARLMEHCLRADLPGFRAYFPVFPGKVLGHTPQQLVQSHYPTVPLRQPLAELTSLVDISHITRETGWAPSTEMEEAPEQLPEPEAAAAAACC